VVDNGDRSHTVPLPSKASVYLPANDEDWFSVHAPDDGRAHVIELLIAQEAGLRVAVTALAGADFAQIGSGILAAGVTNSVYVSVGPGTTTLIQILPFTGAGRRADLTFNLTAENDDYEPNDTPEQAATIATNTTVSAELIAPFASGTDVPVADWYRVELTQGTATLSLLGAPAVGRFNIQRVSSLGVAANIVFTVDGEIGSWPIAVPASGTYLIAFTRYTGFAPFTVGAKPAHLSQPYSFQIQQ
jgi:hypothetical protein